METWTQYLALCRQGWLEAARHWNMWNTWSVWNMAGFMPGFSGSFPDARTREAEKTDWEIWSQSVLTVLPSVPGFPMNTWADTLSAHWLPRIEAQIEPFSVEGTEQALRLSMRIFTPWGGEPLWVEALVGQQEKTDLPRPSKRLPQQPDE
jgi:hypothetical protein